MILLTSLSATTAANENGNGGAEPLAPIVPRTLSFTETLLGNGTSQAKPTQPS